MGRVVLPPEVTPELLEQLFAGIIRLEPRKERAVRLRLQGLVYREIVAALNLKSPNEKPVNLMWVKRGCITAETQLMDFLTTVDKIDEGMSSPVLRRLYAAADRVHSEMVMHRRKPICKRLKVKPEVNIKRAYQCDCGSVGFVRRFVNKGGHRNIIIYTCTACGKEYDKEFLIWTNYKYS